jgi:hypothetical protein
MRKKIIGFSVCMLIVLLPVVSVTAATTSEWPVMEFRGGVGATVIIKNKGNETAYNVEWYVSMEGGFLNHIYKIGGGRFPNLEPGQQRIRKLFIFGLGPVSIHGVLVAEGFQGQGYYIEGFVIGPLVIILQNK